MWKTNLNYLSRHMPILIMVLIAGTLTLIRFVFDGQNGCVDGICGLIIGSNYRDGVWFLAVAKTAFKTFPFQMPIYAGEPLTGYHYVPNLVAYLLSYIGISINFSFYKLFPSLYFFLLIVLGLEFARTIKDKSLFVALFLFFVLFGMPLTTITSLYHKGYIDNSALINTFQATRLLESIHFAFSFLILLYVLLAIYKNKLSLQKSFLIGFFVFLTFGIKFYTAAVIMLILILNETFSLFNKKETKPSLTRLAIFSGSALLAVIVFYNPFGASQTGSIFIFSPFATVHHLIETRDLFYMSDIVNARYFLYEHGFSPRLFAIEFFSVALFIIFYFGTRVIGFLYILKQIIYRKITRFEIVLTITIMVAICASVLFIQKGDWYNPIQFAVVAAFLMNIFAAKFFFELYQKSRLSFWVLFIPIFLLTFPANLVNANYLTHKARFVIPENEMAVLQNLEKLPDGPVLAPIIGNDMAYVSAFSGKPTYVNFVNVLENTGINFEKRKYESEHLDEIVVDTLPIKYVYLSSQDEKFDILFAKFTLSKSYKLLTKNEGAALFGKIK